MPCWTETRITIKDEEWAVRPDIFALALPKFLEQVKKFDFTANVNKYGANIITIGTVDQRIMIDFERGRLIYAQNLDSVKNLLKRTYSEQVIKTVAQRTQIKSKFNLKQTGQLEYNLERRR